MNSLAITDFKHHPLYRPPADSQILPKKYQQANDKAGNAQSETSNFKLLQTI
jgi:hypothetical protein